jgi:hypothetical protein
VSRSRLQFIVGLNFHWHSGSVLIRVSLHHTQFLHVIVYQPFALLALRRLVPDFDEKFIDAGGRIKPWTYNTQWSGIKLGTPNSRYLGGRGFLWHHNLPKEDIPNTIWCTRANLEIFLRKEILETYPGIEVITGTVTSLVEGANGSIKGVVYTPKGQKSAKTMNAALVVGESSFWISKEDL